MFRGFIHWVVLAVAVADVLPQDDECASGECALHALQSKASLTGSCHTAKEGDACYKDIMWAKHTGIKLHPHWYPGLSSHSDDDEFQQIVHKHNPSKCAAPCPKLTHKNCHTALPGDSCYKDVMWAKHTGIHQHPHWYHGLSASSTDEEFQADIHAKRPDKCPIPCAKEEPTPAAPVAPATPVAPAAPVSPAGPAPVIPDVIPEEDEEEEVPEPPPQPAPETTRTTTVRTTTQAEQDNSYQNSPCNQIHAQREREQCFQREIREQQLAREQREREENEQEQHRQENMPLDERQREIIDEIGGVPTEDSLPDFDNFDPDR